MCVSCYIKRQNVVHYVGVKLEKYIATIIKGGEYRSVQKFKL